MGNGLPHASAARFAQAVCQAIKLLFELWLQPYPNRYGKKVLNNLFNSLAARRWLAQRMARNGALDQLALLGHA